MCGSLELVSMEQHEHRIWTVNKGNYINLSSKRSVSSLDCRYSYVYIQGVSKVNIAINIKCLCE